MKNLLILISIFFAAVGYGQTINDKLLQELINDNDFCKYILSKNICGRCDTLYIIDTANLFSVHNIKNMNISKKPIVPFLNSSKFPPYPDTTVIKDWMCKSLYIPYIKKVKKKRYQIYYLYLGMDNSYGFIEYKIKKNNYKKKTYQHGVF